MLSADWTQGKSVGAFFYNLCSRYQFTVKGDPGWWSWVEKEGKLNKPWGASQSINDILVHGLFISSCFQFLPSLSSYTDFSKGSIQYFVLRSIMMQKETRENLSSRTES